MKIKLLLALIFGLFLFNASAETKKVAVLEVFDKMGNVPYQTKLMLRSNLVKAITETPGFVGYDRVNLSQIQKEHNFQRTGLVDDATIKHIGVMTGAKYILTAEASLDSGNLYIIATLIDIESGEYVGSDNEFMESNPSKIYKGCQSLASKLFDADKLNGINEDGESVPKKKNGKIKKWINKLIKH